MRSYSLAAHAKINLYLEIIGDRPDGFHELAMVMQSVGLADRIHLEPLQNHEIRVTCDHPQVPSDESNLAYRAADLLRYTFPEAFKKYGGVEIQIQKQIPVGAGLAGGSANAAAVLVGLDLMWQLGLPQTELQQLGAKLGSDIPFCIAGGTAIATGRGEIISPLPSLDAASVVLAKHESLLVSTPQAYKAYREQFSETYVADPAGVGDRHHTVHSGPLVSAINRQDYAQIGELLHNDLEKVVLPLYPQVERLRDAMLQLEPFGAMMSGSGPTVFALAKSLEQAEHIKIQLGDRLSDPDLGIWVTQLVPTGVQLIP